MTEQDLTLYFNSVSVNNPEKLLSAKELEKEAGTLVGILIDLKGDWSMRNDALKRIQSIVASENRHLKCFTQFMQTLLEPLKSQLSDLRSSIVKETCRIICIAANLIGHPFVSYADKLIQTLCKVVQNGTTLISDNGYTCMTILAKTLKSPQLLGNIMEMAKAKNIRGRQCAYECLYLIIKAGHVLNLSPFKEILELSIKTGVKDADGIARAFARKAFSAYSTIFIEEAKPLLIALGDKVAKAIKADGIPSGPAASAMKKEHAIVRDIIDKVIPKQVKSTKNIKEEIKVARQKMKENSANNSVNSSFDQLYVKEESNRKISIVSIGTEPVNLAGNMDLNFSFTAEPMEQCEIRKKLMPQEETQIKPMEQYERPKRPLEEEIKVQPSIIKNAEMYPKPMEQCQIQPKHMELCRTPPEPIEFYQIQRRPAEYYQVQTKPAEPCEKKPIEQEEVQPKPMEQVPLYIKPTEQIQVPRRTPIEIEAARQEDLSGPDLSIDDLHALADIKPISKEIFASIFDGVLRSVAATLKNIVRKNTLRVLLRWLTENSPQAAFLFADDYKRWKRWIHFALNTMAAVSGCGVENTNIILKLMEDVPHAINMYQKEMLLQTIVGIDDRRIADNLNILIRKIEGNLGFRELFPSLLPALCVGTKSQKTFILEYFSRRFFDEEHWDLLQDENAFTTILKEACLNFKNHSTDSSSIEATMCILDVLSVAKPKELKIFLKSLDEDLFQLVRDTAISQNRNIARFLGDNKNRFITPIKYSDVALKKEMLKFNILERSVIVEPEDQTEKTKAPMVDISSFENTKPRKAICPMKRPPDVLQERPRTPAKQAREETPSRQKKEMTPTRQGKEMTPKRIDRGRTPTRQDRSKTPPHELRNKTPPRNDGSRTPPHRIRANIPYVHGLSDTFYPLLKNKTSNYLDQFKTPPRQDRSKTPTGHDINQTRPFQIGEHIPERQYRSKTPEPRNRSKIPEVRNRSKTPEPRNRSKTPDRQNRSKTPPHRVRGITPSHYDQTPIRLGREKEPPTHNCSDKTPKRHDREKSPFCIDFYKSPYAQDICRPSQHQNVQQFSITPNRGRSLQLLDRDKSPNNQGRAKSKPMDDYISPYSQFRIAEERMKSPYNQFRHRVPMVQERMTITNASALVQSPIPKMPELMPIVELAPFYGKKKGKNRNARGASRRSRTRRINDIPNNPSTSDPILTMNDSIRSNTPSRVYNKPGTPRTIFRRIKRFREANADKIDLFETNSFTHPTPIRPACILPNLEDLTISTKTKPEPFRYPISFIAHPSKSECVTPRSALRPPTQFTSGYQLQSINLQPVEQVQENADRQRNAQKQSIIRKKWRRKVANLARNPQKAKRLIRRWRKQLRRSWGNMPETSGCLTQQQAQSFQKTKKLVSKVRVRHFISFKALREIKPIIRRKAQYSLKLEQACKVSSSAIVQQNFDEILNFFSEVFKTSISDSTRIQIMHNLEIIIKTHPEIIGMYLEQVASILIGYCESNCGVPFDIQLIFELLVNTQDPNAMFKLLQNSLYQTPIEEINTKFLKMLLALVPKVPKDLVTVLLREKSVEFTHNFFKRSVMHRMFINALVSEAKNYLGEEFQPFPDRPEMIQLSFPNYMNREKSFEEKK